MMANIAQKYNQLITPITLCSLYKEKLRAEMRTLNSELTRNPSHTGIVLFRLE